MTFTRLLGSPGPLRCARTSGSGRSRLRPGALVVLLLAASPLMEDTRVLSTSAFGTNPPSTPASMSAASITAQGASLSWAKSRDNVRVVGYLIYRGPASAPASELTLIAANDRSASSYKAGNLMSGTGYTFGVRAVDADNNVSSMRTTTFRTSSSGDTTAPLPPSDGSFSTAAFSSSRIDLRWGASPSTDVAKYEVLRNGNVVAAVQRPFRERYSDNGLSPATSYGYSIRAVDSAGNRSVPTKVRSRSTMAAGTVAIARGPYTSRVTAGAATISWWTNIPTQGAVSVNRASLRDRAGVVRHHKVRVTGLRAGTRYSYRVTGGPASERGSFATAARRGQAFQFAAIGDFGGQGSGEQQNADNVAAARTQFVQTVGDNIYPSAGYPDPDFSRVYSDFDARFFKQFGQVVRNQAFFPANGNKEYYANGQFWNAFPMPGANHSWYSYNWGPAHILVIDTERPYAPGTRQYRFARLDLARHRSYPWRIVISHFPPYSSTTSTSSALEVRKHLVPLFERQKVALVMSGNSHNYERSHRLLGGRRVRSGGITYVVTGGGGNGLNKFTSPKPAWSAYRQSAFYEFTKVSVFPRRLVVSGIRADTNTVFDSVTIRRTR